MLKIKGLVVDYGNTKVISSSDLLAYEGVTCIIGKSGTGKTSVLNALAGQIDYQCESYFLSDIRLDEMPLNQQKDFIRNHYAYFIQGNNFISDLSCFDNIRMYAKFSGVKINDQEIQSLLKQVGLGIDATVFPDNLSGGEKQRLALAQALAKNTEVILCDEFTASLDEDLKQDVYDLLEKIAKEYHKIIIITSHDPEIYQQCQHIYDVSNGRLEEVKKESSIKEISVQKKENSSLKRKDFFKYVMDKAERQLVMQLIYSVICALVVAISVFIIYYRTNYLKEQSEILSRLSQNEMYIINQTTPIYDDIFSYMYSSQNEPFKNEISEKIKALDHVEHIYPYYIWNNVKDYDHLDPSYRPTLQICSSKTENCKEISADAFEYNYIPYYQEQSFETKHEIINEDATNHTGVFINRNLYMNMGLTKEDLENAVLKTTVAVPYAYHQSVAEMSKTGSYETIDVDTYMPVSQLVDIELPVIGVLSEYYNEETSALTVYITIEYMEELRSNLSKEVILSEENMAWTPNAYILFTENMNEMNQINQAIHNLDPQITTGNKYMDNSVAYASNNYINHYTLVAIFIILGSGFILAFVYGIYYFIKNKDDILYYQRNGLTKKEFYRLLQTDCFLQSILVILLSSVFLICLFLYGNTRNWYCIPTLILSQLPLVILCIISFPIIQTLLSRLYYYIKIKK